MARQIELMQHAATSGASLLGPIHGVSDRPLLPPHLQGQVPLPLLRQPLTAYLPVGLAAPGSASPLNAAPHPGMLRLEEDCMD